MILGALGLASSASLPGVATSMRLPVIANPRYVAVGKVTLAGQTVTLVRDRHLARSKYNPHQGAKEKARRKARL